MLCAFVYMCACDLTTFICFIYILFIIGCLYSYLENADGVHGARNSLHCRHILTPFPGNKQHGFINVNSMHLPFLCRSGVQGKEYYLAVADGASTQDYHATNTQGNLLCPMLACL